MKSSEEILKIVTYGGGVIIDSSMPTDDLVRLAAYAKDKGTIIIKNAGAKSTEDLVRIASYGSGHVIFDLL